MSAPTAIAASNRDGGSANSSSVDIKGAEGGASPGADPLDRLIAFAFTAVLLAITKHLSSPEFAPNRDDEIDRVVERLRPSFPWLDRGKIAQAQAAGGRGAGISEAEVGTPKSKRHGLEPGGGAAKEAEERDGRKEDSYHDNEKVVLRGSSPTDDHGGESESDEPSRQNKRHQVLEPGDVKLTEEQAGTRKDDCRDRSMSVHGGSTPQNDHEGGSGVARERHAQGQGVLKWKQHGSAPPNEPSPPLLPSPPQLQPPLLVSGEISGAGATDESPTTDSSHSEGECMKIIWRCAVCMKKDFEEYEECVAHEAVCDDRAKLVHGESPPPNDHDRRSGVAGEGVLKRKRHESTPSDDREGDSGSDQPSQKQSKHEGRSGVDGQRHGQGALKRKQHGSTSSDDHEGGSGSDEPSQKQSKPITWAERIAACRAYHVKHGHLDIKPKDPDLGHYSAWITRIRQDVKLLEQGRKTKQLNPSKLAELRTVGFQTVAERRSDRFQRMFAELEKYKCEHGHCNVAQSDRSDLGKWVISVKEEYYRLMKGKQQSTSLTSSEIARLTELGFAFPRRGSRVEWAKSRTWEEWMELCRSFLAENGHLKIPRAHPTLGQLCGRLRKAYKTRKEGGQDSFLSDKRERELDDMGFVWLAGSRIETRRGPDGKRLTRSWDEWYGMLLEFREQHGHATVPQHHPGGLGKWVNSMRKAAKYLQKGEGKEGKLRGMTHERYMKLADVGFVFNASKLRGRGSATYGSPPLVDGSGE